jgi:phage repressor protein C with HTH and peptisase S24 domain
VSAALLKQGITVSAGALQNRYAKDGYMKEEELKAIAKSISAPVEELTGSKIDSNSVTLSFYPEVYLSAGYGVTVIDEKPEKIVIDSKLLISDKGIKVNPELCEVVMISGNSMSPEYRHGDRVIIDKGDTELADGHIFAFRYKGQCYVKEINLLGNKIKCISINKEYDPFYIDENEDFQVFGRIIPRIRL